LGLHRAKRHLLVTTKRHHEKQPMQYSSNDVQINRDDNHQQDQQKISTFSHSWLSVTVIFFDETSTTLKQRGSNQFANGLCR